MPPLPPARSILPSLTIIQFKGASDYLEIFARIDVPRLNKLHMIFFNQPYSTHSTQLLQLISRRPMLGAPEQGHIAFGSKAIIVRFLSQISDFGVLSMQTPCMASKWQPSSLDQVCSSSRAPVSTGPRWNTSTSSRTGPPFLRNHVGISLRLRESKIPTTLARRC